MPRFFPCVRVRARAQRRIPVRTCVCLRLPAPACALPCAGVGVCARACACVACVWRACAVPCPGWGEVRAPLGVGCRLRTQRYAVCGVVAGCWGAHSGDMPAEPHGARRGGQIPPQARRTGAAAHTPAVCADGEGSPRRSHAPMGSGHQSMRLAFAPVTSPAGQRVRCGDHRTGVCAGK